MTSVSAYLKELDEPRKSELQQLHALICKAAPKLKPYIQQSGNSEIAGYGKYSYKTKSGCTGDWFVIGLASRK